MAKEKNAIDLMFGTVSILTMDLIMHDNIVLYYLYKNIDIDSYNSFNVFEYIRNYMFGEKNANYNVCRTLMLIFSLILYYINK